MFKRPTLLSIAIPIFNEQENIEILYEKISDVAQQLTTFDSYEIIAINDGSSDDSLKKLESIAATDPHLKIISFARNFGHEAATTAGLQHASGTAVAIMDADLQDPPELLLQFEQVLKQGYDIAYGQRKKRLNESFFKKLTSKLFYPLFRWLTNVDMPRDVGDCCMLSRRALNAFKNLHERSLFVRGMIYWSGLSKKAVPFVRQKRAGGKTKYNYLKLSKFALDNIITFSTTPMYLIILLSSLSITACTVGAIVALIMKIKGLVVMTGWTSLLMSMLFLFSVTLFFLGIIGLYIGKIFEEVKQRPRYLVIKKINFESTPLPLRDTTKCRIEGHK
jgi:dolichol-phosphate mannosyltransferase